EVYPGILTHTLKEALRNKNKSQTWAICQKPFEIVGLKRTTKGVEQKVETFKRRSVALQEKIELEHLPIVLQEINAQLGKTSGLLSEISDRSIELIINEETVGQNLYNQLKNNPHTRLKNQIFYRQDYLDEFEAIWQEQA